MGELEDPGRCLAPPVPVKKKDQHLALREGRYVLTDEGAEKLIGSSG